MRTTTAWFDRFPPAFCAMHRIRSEQPDDSAALRNEICRRCWHASYSHLLSPATIDGVFDGDVDLTGSWLTRRTRLIDRSYAEVDGMTVGFIEVGELNSPPSGEVVALYVLPAFARRGLGRLLWQEGCRRLSLHGLQTVQVWAIAEAQAPKFYEAMGCVPVATGKMGVGETDLAVTEFSCDVTSVGKD
jgi:GNAT superfamily N-acetyltransferase